MTCRTKILVFMLMTAGLSGTAVNSWGSSFPAALQSGYNAKDPEERAVNYTKAIDAWTPADGNKSKAVAYGARAFAYYELKLYDKALGDYDKALALDPAGECGIGMPGAAYNARGAVYSYLKQYEKALADYAKAIELKPDYAYAYANRGDIYLKLKIYDQAIAEYNSAAAADPAYGGVYSGRGQAYAALKQYDKAVSDYSTLIVLKSNHPGGYYARGNLYSLLKQYDRALADYDKAAELDPSSADAYNGRGIAHLLLGKSGQAKADFLKAEAAYSAELARPSAGAAAYGGRGWNYLWLGRCEKAKKDFDKAVKTDADDAAHYGNLGIYWWSCGHSKKSALGWFTKSFERGFDQWEALYAEASDGHFLKGLNGAPEFKALVKKYRK